MNMTSLLWRHVYIERSQLVQYFTHSLTICQVLNVIASYEYQKNECVQQWNLFKIQTSTFYFSTYCPNLFEHLLIHAGQTVWETRLLRSLDQSLKQHIGQVFFINNTFSSTSKLLTPNMYCWSCKTLVTIYWTHLRVNGIWAMSFCQEKMNNRTLFLTGCFQR